MKTYQDLELLGEDEKSRMEFIRAAVHEHMGSAGYRMAENAEQYYAKKNVTMEKYQKTVRTVTGQTVPDVWSSNYKLTHGFFRMFVLQQANYVLENGVNFQQEDTAEKLGRSFARRLKELAKKAMVDGVSFGFWNMDHLDVFQLVETGKEPGFTPLYDRDSGLLRAGVRHWTVADGESRRWTLYEQEGYTDYVQRKGEDMKPMGERRAYILTEKSTQACGVEEVEGENYPGFPIIPMYANDLRESELIGIRSSIDCYDFIKSGMANNIDETSAFYWALKGTGGMGDKDLVQFVNRMKQLHAVVLDRGVEAEAHTIEVPVEANKMLLDYLKNDMYETFMLMNPAKALGSNITATAIELAYQQQDDKCSDFQGCIEEFIERLFCIVGIEDTPSFKWNKVSNQTEVTSMVLMAAEYLDDELIVKKLPWLTPREAEELLKRRAAEELSRTVQETEKQQEAAGTGIDDQPPGGE